MVGAAEAGACRCFAAPPDVCSTQADLLLLGGCRYHLVRPLSLPCCHPTTQREQVYEKKVASLAEFNLQNGSSVLNAGGRPGSGNSLYSPDKLRAATSAAAAAPHMLRIPRVVGTETLLSTRCKRSFSNAHTYHINSIALSSDCETFISADDLRVNLWHLDRWVGCRAVG